MTIAVGALVLALLERSERLRFRASPLWRAHAASDVIYLLTGYVAGGSLALAYIVATSHWLGRIGLPRLAAPRWASVPLALVALDLGNYAAHWLLHRVDVLWEFHKAHHSSPTLDWLATFRSHLVEQTLRRLVAPTLLIVAGVPPDAVVVAAALFTAWAMLNHSNLALDLGLLERVLVTPALHRVHHVPRTTERNLGTVFVFWDALRGTLVRTGPGLDCTFGVPGETETYPQGWLAQLREPMRRVGRGLCVARLWAGERRSGGARRLPF